MVYLSSIQMINLQSHKDTLIELPETGIVRFLGHNSNGKSVASKALGKLIRNRLHIERERVPLVRRGVESGYLILTRSDGMVLVLHVAREASKTYVELRIPNEEKTLKRHITTDKNITELVRMFGFHVDIERGFTLNLYETFDPLLMVNTTGAENASLVTSVITDHKAEQAKMAMIEQRTTLTNISKNIEKEIITQEAVLGSLKFYPEEEYLSKANMLRYLAQSLSNLATPSFKHVRYIPNVDEILLLDTTKVNNVKEKIKIKPTPSLETINILDLSDINLPKINEKLSGLVVAVTSFQEGKCGLCGKGFAEGGHNHAGA